MDFLPNSGYLNEVGAENREQVRFVEFESYLSGTLNNDFFGMVNPVRHLLYRP